MPPYVRVKGKCLQLLVTKRFDDFPGASEFDASMEAVQ